MRTYLFIIFATLSTASFGQVDTTSLYYAALKYYNIHLEKSDYKTDEIFIENNNGITNRLPQQVGNRLVTILTWENQKDVYAKHSNKLRHVIIFPANTKDDMIEIQFTPYFGEYKGKKKGYSLGLSSWVIVQFKFDCKDNKFKYWNTETGGI